MEVVKPESVYNDGYIRKNNAWFGEFTDHNGVSRQLKLLTHHKQSEYLGELLDELLHTRKSAGLEPESLAELLTLLPQKSIQQLVDWDLVDHRRAQLGVRLVDHIDGFVDTMANALRRDTRLMKKMREDLVGFLLALGWYVWENIDIAQAQAWYHALPKYGPRWATDARPREEAKAKLVVFIGFVGWLAKQRGLPENPAFPLSALLVSEEEEKALARQQRDLRRLPPRRIRRPES